MDRKRILLVEDHTTTREFMTGALQRRGFDVIAAGSAEDAAILIKDNVFDLMISDIGLPGASGLDLAALIRAKNPFLHAIAVTALGRNEDREKIEAAGFSAHLVKPITMAKLEEAMKGLIL